MSPHINSLCPHQHSCIALPGKHNTSLKTQKDLLGEMNGHSQMAFSRSFCFLIYKIGLTELPPSLEEHHHRSGLVITTYVLISTAISPA